MNKRKKPVVPVVHAMDTDEDLYGMVTLCSVVIYPDGPEYEDTDEAVTCQRCLKNAALYPHKEQENGQRDKGTG